QPSARDKQSGLRAAVLIGAIQAKTTCRMYGEFKIRENQNYYLLNFQPISD
ncbi:hypothetical protein AAULR_25986, partial [Lacticaseibacillus rhamnosus MTCC 5462]